MKLFCKGKDGRRQGGDKEDCGGEMRWAKRLKVEQKTSLAEDQTARLLDCKTVSLRAFEPSSPNT